MKRSTDGPDSKRPFSRQRRVAVLKQALLGSVAALAIGALPQSALAQTYTGGAAVVNDSVVWEVPANWSTGVVPDGIDAAAIIGPKTLFIGSVITLGSLQFKASPANYAITRPQSTNFVPPTGLPGLSGSNAVLEFDVSSGSASIVSSGSFSRTITIPVVLNDDLDVNVTNPSQRFVLQGAVSGAGGITLSGPGEVLFTGLHTYTGDTVINAGRLLTAAESLPGDVTVNSELDFLQIRDGTYAGVISGNGRIFRSLGNGVLTLTGNSPFTGNFNVSRGGLRVDGSLAGLVSFTGSSQKTLSGTGTIGSLSVGGTTIQPGPGIGTLTVTGDAAIVSGSTLVAQIDPSGTPSTDLLSVGGNVTGVNSLTIQVDGATPWRQCRRLRCGQ